jgi:hypothetical protein
MDPASLLANLSAVTGGLKPSPGVSAADLDEIRTLCAFEILRGNGSFLSPPVSFDNPSSLSGASATVSPAETAALSRVGESAISALAKDNATYADTRVFRRAQPVLTPQLPDSIPAWAAGWAVARTIGPFVDGAGRSFWFDLRHIVRQVQVTGGPGGLVLFTMRLAGHPQPGAKYALPAGTIWIRSKFLAADAPEGGFTGLLIKSGELVLSAPATTSASLVVLTLATRFELDLKLAAPAALPPAPPGPGGDAQAALATTPGGFPPGIGPCREFGPEGGSLASRSGALATKTARA